MQKKTKQKNPHSTSLSLFIVNKADVQLLDCAGGKVVSWGAAAGPPYTIIFYWGNHSVNCWKNSALQSTHCKQWLAALEQKASLD